MDEEEVSYNAQGCSLEQMTTKLQLKEYGKVLD